MHGTRWRPNNNLLICCLVSTFMIYILGSVKNLGFSFKTIREMDTNSGELTVKTLSGELTQNTFRGVDCQNTFRRVNSQKFLSSSEKASTLKEKNLLPLGANSFLLEWIPFPKGIRVQERKEKSQKLYKMA